MGQYYKAVNIDKKEYIEPWEFENGAKLMEHSWVGNTFVDSVGMLLVDGGRWAGDRIVWAGDYADVEEKYKQNYYSLTNTDKFSELKSHNMIQLLPPNYTYVCCIDTKEYVNISNIPVDKNDWQINPISLMTADGNGRGGGDFHTESEEQENIIGKWAKLRIVIHKDAPEGYTELDFNLTE